MVLPACFFLYACFAPFREALAEYPERLAAGVDGVRFDLTEEPDG